jgi:hypothetical protein
MSSGHGSTPPSATREASGPVTDASTPWLQHAAGGRHRIEAHLSGFQFAPHRHDTYAVALTLQGVQCFDYRGTARHSLPGGVVVIHPDELHDGRPGTSDGFRYRSIHIEPARIQQMIGGAVLPFIAGGTSTDPRLIQPVQALLADYQRPLADLEFDDALFDLSIALAALSTPLRRTKQQCVPGLSRARQRARSLEAVAGLPRAVRHQPLSLPADAQARTRAENAGRWLRAGRGCGGLLFRGPEPFHPQIPPGLRCHAREVGTSFLIVARTIVL